MKQDNLIESTAAAFYSALAADLPTMEYDYRSPESKKRGTIEWKTEVRLRRPDKRDVEAQVFPQTWGSTALGFGGMGGAAVTTAYTTVVYMNHRSHACVYFDGRFAYSEEKPPEVFWADLKDRALRPAYEAKGRYGETVRTLHHGKPGFEEYDR